MYAVDVSNDFPGKRTRTIDWLLLQDNDCHTLANRVGIGGSYKGMWFSMYQNQSKNLAFSSSPHCTLYRSNNTVNLGYYLVIVTCFYELVIPAVKDI